MLFFRLNYILGHGKSWPFHGTNLMLHGCATFLLGCICKQVLQLQKLTCLITASLFAVHPIHTEAVSSVTRFLFNIKSHQVTKRFIHGAGRCWHFQKILSGFLKVYLTHNNNFWNFFLPTCCEFWKCIHTYRGISLSLGET